MRCASINRENPQWLLSDKRNLIQNVANLRLHNIVASIFVIQFSSPLTIQFYQLLQVTANELNTMEWINSEQWNDSWLNLWAFQLDCSVGTTLSLLATMMMSHSINLISDITKKKQQVVTVDSLTECCKSLKVKWNGQ